MKNDVGINVDRPPGVVENGHVEKAPPNQRPKVVTDTETKPEGPTRANEEKPKRFRKLVEDWVINMLLALLFIGAACSRSGC